VFCKCTWVYVSKTDSPSAWAVSHTFVRRDVEAWFESVIRPMLVRMVELKGVRGQYSVAADHDGCQRCFVKLSCNPYEGLQKGNVVMAFDLNKLKREQASVPDPVAEPSPAAYGMARALEAASEMGRAVGEASLEAQLAASVAINRPRSAPNLLSGLPELIETTGEESVGLVVDADETSIETAIEAQALAEAKAPKARRGRPRGSKNAVSVASSEPSAPVTGATTASAKALYEEAEALATAAQGILDQLDGLRGRFSKVLEEIDKRVATTLRGAS
jgi:hypothetical protein